MLLCVTLQCGAILNYSVRGFYPFSLVPDIEASTILPFFSLHSSPLRKGFLAIYTVISILNFQVAGVPASIVFSMNYVVREYV